MRSTVGIPVLQGGKDVITMTTNPPTAPRFSVAIQTHDFDVSAELANLRAYDGRIGAVCSFVGTVRDSANLAPANAADNARLLAMELEHYPGMTEKAIDAILAAAHSRFGILAARVIHRVGALNMHDHIVLVAVAASHRGQAFEACEFVMDYLKTQAPFWKKEHTAAGAHWVDARESDEHARMRWEPTGAASA